MRIKYDHKPPQRLYMKIFVGYFLLIGLVLTAATLVYMEYRNIGTVVKFRHYESIGRLSR